MSVSTNHDLEIYRLFVNAYNLLAPKQYNTPREVDSNNESEANIDSKQEAEKQLNPNGINEDFVDVTILRRSDGVPSAVFVSYVSYIIQFDNIFQIIKIQGNHHN